MQSILHRIMTRMVAGHRRIISPTVMSGSIASGMVTGHASKEAHPRPLGRRGLCACANSKTKRITENSARYATNGAACPAGHSKVKWNNQCHFGFAMPPAIPHRSVPQAEMPLVHPSVDRAFIGALVRDFYDRVRADARLGPIFASEIRGDWEPHLEKMTDFWCSVILKNGAYSGRPVPAHLKLKQVRDEDFDIWLGHFRKTVDARCPPDVSEVFIDRAERIAQSLKLAMFFRLDRPAGEATG